VFSKIKLYLYGALATIGILLFGWVKLLQYKNNKLEAKVEAKEKEIAVKNKVVGDKQQLDKQLDSAKKEAEEVAHENNQKRIARTRPSGNFGDPRL
jgi:hypothetical protein